MVAPTCMPWPCCGQTRIVETLQRSPSRVAWKLCIWCCCLAFSLVGKIGKWWEWWWRGKGREANRVSFFSFCGGRPIDQPTPNSYMQQLAGDWLEGVIYGSAVMGRGRGIIIYDWRSFLWLVSQAMLFPWAVCCLYSGTSEPTIVHSRIQYEGVRGA